MRYLLPNIKSIEYLRSSRYTKKKKVEWNKCHTFYVPIISSKALDFFNPIPKIKSKLQTLFDVGLGYLTLGQSATTLSGGEAQRVKLASELYKRITEKSIYILDEPTTGLHSDDVNRLIKVIQRIVDQGATMIIIEHNLDIIKNADHVIDLGPEGGEKGGSLVASGTPEKVSENKNSYTGKFLKSILSKK